MPKAQRGGAGIDDERPVVQRAMVSRTKRDQIVRVMGPVLGARRTVVNIHERSVPAAGRPAASGVASKHLAANRRRNGLLGTRGASMANWRGSMAAHVGVGEDVHVGVGAVNVGDGVRAG